MLRIRVEATSANVCVGFDVLGIALDLYNEFTFEKKECFSFKGFAAKYSTIEHNLVYDSYIEVFKRLNKNPIPVEIGFSGDIPVSRGLGSSSSLIVAGVFAANEMLEKPLTKDECFCICASLEGHPDNVAPAIYGSLIASYKKDEKYYPIKYEISEDLKFIVIIPKYELKTQDARNVLPKELPYKDIVSNLSRIVNIPKAFKEGNLELLKDLFEDKLHEPYRSKLIKEYDIIKNICDKNNLPFAISGSGSTMLVITKDLNIAADLGEFDCDIKILNVGKGIKILGE